MGYRRAPPAYCEDPAYGEELVAQSLHYDFEQKEEEEPEVRSTARLGAIWERCPPKPRTGAQHKEVDAERTRMVGKKSRPTPPPFAPGSQFPLGFAASSSASSSARPPIPASSSAALAWSAPPFVPERSRTLPWPGLDPSEEEEAEEE